MAVGYKQLESAFGFKSPFFSVDDNGNVTLRSITYLDEQSGEVDLTPDFSLSETQGDINFFVTELQEINPTIELTRGEEYVFALTLVNLTFRLESSGDSYTSGLSYTADGVEYQTDGAAQLKKTGFIVLNVAGNAPDTLSIVDPQTGKSITLDILDPVFTGNGNFNNLTATGNINFIGANSDIIISPTGSSTVEINPAAGSLSNMAVSATSLTATQEVNFTTVNSNITIVPTLNGKLVIDSGITGTMDNVNIGQTSPAAGTFNNLIASSGSLNNIVIGDTSPSEGTFTSLVVNQTPQTNNEVANKQYVDNNSIVYAIAFGL